MCARGWRTWSSPYLNHQRFTAISNGTVIPAEEAHPNQNGAGLQLLSIGRLVLRKGFLEIIKALSLVRRERDDFHLRIVGYGRAEDEIRRVLEEHSISDKSLCWDAWSTSDSVNIFSIRMHICSTVIAKAPRSAMIEAGAYGLPIIASDHPGNRTYVKNGESGFLSSTKILNRWHEPFSLCWSTGKNCREWGGTAAR